jgi:hypothetical protein
VHFGKPCSYKKVLSLSSKENKSGKFGIFNAYHKDSISSKNLSFEFVFEIQVSQGALTEWTCTRCTLSNSVGKYLPFLVFNSNQDSIRFENKIGQYFSGHC